MINDQEIAHRLLNMIDTAHECANILIQLLAQQDVRTFKVVLNDLISLINSIQDISPSLKKQENALNLPEASVSVHDSLIRINILSGEFPEKAMHKLEFELIPLLEDMRAKFYFWGVCFPDPKRLKKYYEEDIYCYNQNQYVKHAEELGGVYKYDLSIFVVAYNKINYTKQCIRSLLKHLPNGLNYELVLVNHGSNDGTKEYFESLNPDKQLDIAINGGGLGAVNRILEGKYRLAISNDVLVTKNAISNLYQCINSDDSIAWAVPATSNVSNLQSIAADYNTFEELELFAEKNNILNPLRREQRIRLCNPIDIRRNKTVFELQTVGYLYSKVKNAFPDDVASLLYRRNNYKMVLVKDAYCHHFGSATLKEEMGQKDIYNTGRIDFKNKFGVDPWGLGFCYDPELFNLLPCNDLGHIDILGINCGLGSNSLKIKEKIKELTGNTDICLYNYADCDSYLADLKGISDYAGRLNSWNPFNVPNAKPSYDYIIVESIPEKNKHFLTLWNILVNKLSPSGYLIIKLKNRILGKQIQKSVKTLQTVPSIDGASWFIYHHS